MLEVHKIYRVSHVVACLIVYLLFYGRGWQRGVPNVIKNDHFLMLLAIWVLFH